VADVQLPDTGIGPNQCYQAGSDILGACSNEYLQDGDLGRDANPDTNNDLDGKLGFSFAGVYSNGELYRFTGNNYYPCARDNLTGLMWSSPRESFAHIISEANDAVVTSNNSKHCGYDDWRLPTVTELIGIVDYGYEAGGSYSNEIWAWPGLYVSSTIDPLSDPLGVVLGSTGHGSVYTNSIDYGMEIMFVRGENY
jgi:hypothetical protein